MYKAIFVENLFRVKFIYTCCSLEKFRKGFWLFPISICESDENLFTAIFFSEDDTCPNVAIPNGSLLPGCARQKDSICSYSCNVGYEQNSKYPQLTCDTSGKWMEDVNVLCQSKFFILSSGLHNLIP